MANLERRQGLGYKLGEVKEEEGEEGDMRVDEEEEDEGEDAFRNNHGHGMDSSSLLLHHPRLAPGQGLASRPGQGLAASTPGLACKRMRSQKRGKRRVIYEADDEGSVEGHTNDDEENDNKGGGHDDDEGDHDGVDVVECKTLSSSALVQHKESSSSNSPLAHTHAKAAVTLGPGLAQRPGLGKGPVSAQGPGLLVGKAFVHPSPFARRHVYLNDKQ